MSRTAASGLSEVFLARQRRRKSWNSGLHEWASLRSGMPLVVIKKRAWVFHTRGINIAAIPALRREHVP